MNRFAPGHDGCLPKCPLCNREQSDLLLPLQTTHSGMGTFRSPQAGSAAYCLHCGALLILSDAVEGGARNPSIEETDALSNLPASTRGSLNRSLPVPTLRYFRESADEGSDCLCSWCTKPIPELSYAADGSQENLEESPAVRLHPEDAPHLEVRFHPRCFEEAMRTAQVCPA